jgi:hypothetical protein
VEKGILMVAEWKLTDYSESYHKIFFIYKLILVVDKVDVKHLI